MSQLAEREQAASPQRVNHSTGENFVRPAVNIRHDAEGYTLEVEMPGVSKDGVEITFEDGRLTLIGRRATAEQAARAIYRESTRAAYRRVFDLDPSVDAAHITATVDQGVLSVRLPKAEAAKPRKITVS